MSARHLARVGVLAAGGALVAASLTVAPPAHAAPVFTDAQTHLDFFGGASSYAPVNPVTCNNVPSGGTEPDIPVVENGPAVTGSTSASATFTNSGNAADTATGVASATGTGKVSSVGGNLSTIDLSVTSNAQLNNALGTSADCVRYIYSGIDLDFEFTVTQPGFLNLTTKNTSGNYGEVYIYQYVAGGPGGVYVDAYGNGLKFNSTMRTFLPAGTYRGYFEGEVYKRSTSSYAISGTTVAHGDFHVAGSQTAAVSGKGKKYVTLPAGRSCAAHSLTPTITSKKKRANQVKQVRFLVNDRVVKKVRTPDKGDIITLPIADDVTADVTAVVKLFPKRKGKPAKELEVSSSYEACS